MIERLVERVLAGPERRVALELQWALVEDEDERADWVLELHVVVQRAGRHHSELSTTPIHTFPAEALAERQEAHRIANAVAHGAGLPLHAPPVEERGGQGGSNLLRGTPASAPAGYELDWTAVWWTLDGRRHEAAGSEIIDADAGEQACGELLRRLARYPYRPLTVHIRGGDATANQTYTDAPTETPQATVVRTAARAHGCRASRIAREFPAVSPLALMLGFEAAFGWPLDDYQPLVAWRAGTLSDAALDAVLDGHIAGRRRSWERPLVLADRRRAGESIAAFIRAERQAGVTKLALVGDLRDVFPMSLREAVDFLEAALAGDQDDAALDASLPW